MENETPNLVISQEANVSVANVIQLKNLVLKLTEDTLAGRLNWRMSQKEDSLYTVYYLPLYFEGQYKAEPFTAILLELPNPENRERRKPLHSLEVRLLYGPDISVRIVHDHNREFLSDYILELEKAILNAF